MYVNYYRDNWTNFLAFAEFAYNNHKSETTGMTPFYAHQGYHPQFTIDHSKSTKAKSPSATDVAKYLQENHQILREQILKSQERQKEYYDRNHREHPQYQVGDKVWLAPGKQIKTTQPKVFAHRYLGPYTIKKVIGTRNVRLELPTQLKHISDVFHVTRVKPCPNDPIPGQQAPPPEPEEIDGEQEWEVEEILDSRKRREGLRYLVRWAGYPHYPDDERSIEELTNCQELIDDFHRRYPQKPRPRGFQLPEEKANHRPRTNSALKEGPTVTDRPTIAPRH